MSELSTVIENMIKEKADKVFSNYEDDIKVKIGELARPMVESLVEESGAHRITFVDQARPDVTERAHKALPYVLDDMAAGLSPLLVGPAGTGKSYLAVQASKILYGEETDVVVEPMSEATRPSTWFGRQTLEGFTNTAFERVFKNGGVYVADEVDALDPASAVALNAATNPGNREAKFIGDDHSVKAHENFRFVATANTWGTGATLSYVGRNRLDAATLDRMSPVFVDYDNELELQMYEGYEPLVKWVQEVRKQVLERPDLKLVFSMRATHKAVCWKRQGRTAKEIANRLVANWPEQAKREVFEACKADNPRFISPLEK